MNRSSRCQPRTEAHIATAVACLLMLAGAASADELPGEWQTFGGLRNGCDFGGSIDDAVVLPDGDLMLIGGSIEQCADVTIPAGLARFDRQSQTWSAVPGFERASSQNRVFRVGERVFVSSAGINRVYADGLEAFILQLDLATGEWSVPGGGVNGGVQAMVSDGQSLFVGGSFSEAGETDAMRLARYDLSSGVWHPLGNVDGGSVSALALTNGWLYAGGYFDSVDGVNTRRVARMHRGNGQWSALGSGITDTSSSSSVVSLAALGSQVYVGGSFEQVGDDTGNLDSSRVAQWIEDGTSGQWSPIGAAGSLSLSTVWRLVAHPSGLYAAATGQSIWATQLARWTCKGSGASEKCSWQSQVGPIWSPLSAGARIGALADGADIHVFGEMYLIDGLRANGIATYDTSAAAFQALGDAPSQAVTLVTAHDGDRIRALQTVGGVLLAGGLFEEIGAVPSDGFAMWDGTRWFDLSNSGVGRYTPYDQPGSVEEVLALDESTIIAAGDWFPHGAENQNLARCHVALLAEPDPKQPSCTSVGGGTNGRINAMVRQEGSVIIGGRFSEVASQSGAPIAASNLARYELDSNSWQAVGGGVDWEVLAIAQLGNDIYVAGSFDAAGGIPAKNIARFNVETETWHALGKGVGGSSALVNEIVVVGNSVYVGGRFVEAGELSVNNIARWEPMTETWSALGGGIDDPSGVVSLRAVGPTLYVGGFFTQANGPQWDESSLPAQRIAAWDTQTHRWLSLPDGGVQALGAAPRVSAIENYRGAIHLGGSFITAGNLASRHFAAFVPHPIFRGGFESAVDPWEP